MGFVVASPKKVSYFSDSGLTINQVSLGEAHSLVLDSNGSVYSFGWGDLGQLGIKGVQKNADLQF
jgi:alpha-tubulin suppressor-like RCC1 family protein